MDSLTSQKVNQEKKERTWMSLTARTHVFLCHVLASRQSLPQPTTSAWRTVFGHFHRPRVHSTYDVRFHMSPLQASCSHLIS